LAQQPPATVRVVQVRSLPLSEEHRVTGSLRAAHESVVAAREEGALISVNFLVGESVPEGAIVAETDSRRLLAQAKELEANLTKLKAEAKQRRAELAQAEWDLRSMESALEKDAIAERQVWLARTEVEVCQAKILSADAAVLSLGSQQAVLALRIEDSVVKAPFAARVIERMAEPGEWVRPGEPILKLISTGTIEAWLDVPERFAGALNADLPSPSIFLEPAHRSLATKRTRLLPRVHPTARTFPLILDVDDEKGALIPGMSITCLVPMGAPTDRLIVPNDAIVRRPGSATVFCLRQKDDVTTAQQVPVKVIFDHREGSVVEGAIQPTDHVVVEGNERLFEGAPVLVLKDPDAPKESQQESGR
jgi:RND family efflux transporter MFP subunit